MPDVVLRLAGRSRRCDCDFFAHSATLLSLTANENIEEEKRMETVLGCGMLVIIVWLLGEMSTCLISPKASRKSERRSRRRR